ncbi:uncharacterized protein BDR25DRAFT_302052 [Lindgomyces ingoldianus]|uniref:Uncharacterized protein n=1 Tax=Lindgomyces ingoldianus TaxID=673940 RepID=A0ACB6R658_9PLEO|nr:uncharacterized protein BDR25DRAFT_302052 [Lindgomyces ingoldianus]KAF2474012.1 hypothetical protein BDR25DRAFT_302052 [Lindgomyces ingoldianus]
MAGSCSISIHLALRALTLGVPISPPRRAFQDSVVKLFPPTPNISHFLFPYPNHSTKQQAPSLPSLPSQPSPEQGAIPHSSIEQERKEKPKDPDQHQGEAGYEKEGAECDYCSVLPETVAFIPGIQKQFGAVLNYYGRGIGILTEVGCDFVDDRLEGSKIHELQLGFNCLSHGHTTLLVVI